MSPSDPNPNRGSTERDHLGFKEPTERVPTGYIWTPEHGLQRDIGQILEERGSRYGVFSEQARIVQELKDVMRNTANWFSLPPDMKEALEMIQHKVGRILNGDPTYKDSWDDIEGYTRCVSRELKSE